MLRFSLRFKIEDTPNKNKAYEYMRSKIKVIFKILQETDDSIIFSHYNSETIWDDDTGFIPTPLDKVIDDPDKIPPSLAELSKSFFGAWPPKYGDIIWAQVRLLHNETMEDIIYIA